MRYSTHRHFSALGGAIVKKYKSPEYAKTQCYQLTLMYTARDKHLQTGGPCKTKVQTHGSCKTHIEIKVQTQGSCNIVKTQGPCKFILTSTVKEIYVKLL